MALPRPHGHSSCRASGVASSAGVASAAGIGVGGHGSVPWISAAVLREASRKASHAKTKPHASKPRAPDGVRRCPPDPGASHRRDSGGAGPGAVSGGGWDCEHASALDLGELPAPHMEHPVVAVAEKDQVSRYLLI